MNRLMSAAAGLVVLSAGCGLGTGAESTRTVLVDYAHDQFAGAFLSYFPKRVEAHPGDTVVFRQSWSGEPHSVTMGTLVDAFGEQLKPHLEAFAEKGYAGVPPEEPKELQKAQEALPWMVGDDGAVQQNGAQPCYLRSGAPPKDPATPCPRQAQPEFDGRHTYYNSGFIPYEGAGGNTFAMKLSADIEAGEHFFYCNYHGPFMSGFLVVKPPNEPVTSQEQMSEQARTEIDRAAVPLFRAFSNASRGHYELIPRDVKVLDGAGVTRSEAGKTYLSANLAGFLARGVDTALVNEFIPKDITVEAGRPVSWLMLGPHTISFNVPKYFPIIQVAEDGTIAMNPKIVPPAGGAPKVRDESTSKLRDVDGGTFGGDGFWSSGLLFAFDAPIKYTIRFSKPGSYKFACLIHPPMVGTLTVT